MRTFFCHKIEDNFLKIYKFNEYKYLPILTRRYLSFDLSYRYIIQDDQNKFRKLSSLNVTFFEENLITLKKESSKSPHFYSGYYCFYDFILFFFSKFTECTSSNAKSVPRLCFL